MLTSKTNSSNAESITPAMVLHNGLLLRKLEMSDAESFYYLYEKTYAAMPHEESPFQPDETPVDFTRRIMARCICIWTIRLASDPESIVGDAALHDWNKKTSAIEIGGTLLPHCQGKGLMVSVLNYIISYAKEQLNIKTIIGKTALNNEQATRMILKLGFTKSDETDGAAVFEKTLQ